MRNAVIALIVVSSNNWSQGVLEAQSRPWADQAAQSVVRVVARGSGAISTGSGSVVAQGYVLTNWHVVDGGQEFYVASRFVADRLVPAQLIWSSDELDLAVVAVPGLSLPPVTLGTMELRDTETVWAAGFPGSADDMTFSSEIDEAWFVASWNRGVVARQVTSPWRPGGRPLEKIQHDASINRGNSGGPLFNNCGWVIGVNTQGDPEAQGVFLASRITEAAPELARQGIVVRSLNELCRGDDVAATVRADAATARRAAAAAGEAVTTVNEAAATARDDASAAMDVAAEAQENANRNMLLMLVMGTIMLPAMLLLAFRKPRREIVRVVEQTSSRFRQWGHSRYSRHQSSSFVRGKRRSPSLNVRGDAPAVTLASTESGFRLTPQRILVQGTGLGLAAGGFVIGNLAALVDQAVTDPTISRRHARITHADGRFFIEDLNSSNGTRVNGMEVAPFKPQAIRDGDTVQLGGSEVLVCTTRRPLA